ncbi:hypothetical protein D910_03392 [Dendroctonus ponderosae]|uniref:Tc1-like transposase DDE domain-containing protein n=1 Tax=Dendroctonus ponderosae TaxID=77166 RepID=U4U116_DENPD|nr:hypothetical protein D910_03392 [Dendroctonus ponderosae]
MDGASAHFAAPIRAWLNHEYADKWIGRNGPVNWPPRPPDLTPMDFFFWGHIKSLVYRTPVQNEQELVTRIRESAQNVSPGMLRRVHNNMIKRAQTCLELNGQKFEHLL